MILPLYKNSLQKPNKSKYHVEETWIPCLWTKNSVLPCFWTKIPSSFLFQKKKKDSVFLIFEQRFRLFFLNFWWKYVHASLYFFFSVFLIKVDGIGEATSPINLNQHVPLLMEIEKVKNQEKTIPTTCSLVFTYFKRSETKTSTKSNNNVVHFFSSRFG